MSRRMWCSPLAPACVPPAWSPRSTFQTRHRRPRRRRARADPRLAAAVCWGRQVGVTARLRLSVRDHLRVAPRLAAGDLVGTMQELHRRHGPVVDVGYGSGRMILLFGPEANEHVLSTAAHTFEWGEAMQALVAVDGPTALIVSDGDDHRRRRSEEHTSELQSLMRISYAVFCL